MRPANRNQQEVQIMFMFTHRATCAIATAALLGIVVLASPVRAEPTPAPRPSTAAKAKPARADDVEARIKALHRDLHITAAQEPSWQNVAQVMRDNAKAMVDLRKEETQQAKSRNAVEALKSYATVIDAHADGIHKFIPIFQPLYDSMSDAQKKTADAVFRNRTRAAAQRSK
jgi:protein CpxP